MFDVVDNHVFPFLQERAGDSSHAAHMEDARLTIPTPALMQKVVDALDDIPMEDRDTKGDVYEYMLGKIASAGQNGQFRTPRHIIKFMVDATLQPPPTRSATRLLAPAVSLSSPMTTSANTTPKRSKTRAPGALPQRPVQRVRLRQHDAADRVDEHAASTASTTPKSNTATRSPKTLNTMPKRSA